MSFLVFFSCAFAIFYTGEDLKPHPAGVYVLNRYRYRAIGELKCPI
jgi:hypothetical protein